MKKLITTIILVALMATPVLAELTLQEVLNNITSPYPGLSSVTVGPDTIADGLDAYWTTGPIGSIAAIVIEIAASSGENTFGVYDMANPANTVELFSGPQGAGTQASVTIHPNGSVFVNFVDTGIDFAENAFGFYLGTPPQDPQLMVYSDTSLNADQYDHMWAFRGKGDLVTVVNEGIWGPNEYILGWENTRFGGDGDHQDFVVMIESVSPIIPAPGAIILGSIGMGLVGWLRRRRSL